MDIIFLISQSLRARWNNIFESIRYTEKIQMSTSILWMIKSDLLLPELSNDWVIYLYMKYMPLQIMELILKT